MLPQLQCPTVTTSFKAWTVFFGCFWNLLWRILNELEKSCALLIRIIWMLLSKWQSLPRSILEPIWEAISWLISNNWGKLGQCWTQSRDLGGLNSIPNVYLFIYFDSGVSSDWICSSQSGVIWPLRVHFAMSVDIFWVSQLGRHSWYLVEARDTASILQYTGCPLSPQGKGLSSPNSNCVELRKLWFCCCSVIKLCPTLCDPKDCGTPGSTVLHYLPGLAQVLVHWVSDAI